MEATFPLEDDRNRDKRSDAPQASGSRVSSLSLLLVEHCERRDRNGYKGGVRRAVVRRLLCLRTQPSCRGRADDCMARMMHKSNRARSTSEAALLLIGHPGSCLDRRRGRACLLLALVGGPRKDQPLPGVVRCREAATGRSPG